MAEKKLLSKQIAFASIGATLATTIPLVVMNILPVEFGALMVVTSLSSILIASQITVQTQPKTLKAYCNDGRCFVVIRNYSDNDIAAFKIQDNSDLLIVLNKNVTLPKNLANKFAGYDGHSKFQHLLLKSDISLFNSKLNHWRYKYQHIENAKFDWRIELVGVEGDNLVIGNIDRT
jgi:hypothetical protein